MLKPCVLILVFGLLVASCSDDEETAREARANCDAFLEAWCEKVDSCFDEDAYADCLSIIRQELNCGAAVETGSQYEQCRTDIESTTCAAIDGPPASCQGVILVE